MINRLLAQAGNSKIAFIIVLYKTPMQEISRIESEIIKLGFRNFKIYFIDNTRDNKGYAGGVNRGLKEAREDESDLFVIMNPDISLGKLKAGDIMAGSDKYDIWGLALRQAGQIYYGGELDKNRLTAGLINLKPQKRFVAREWISGSLMMVKRRVVDDIGMFDEKFFMYYEEVDFCYRALKAGYSVGLDSQSSYEHFENSTTNSGKQKNLFASRWRFFIKYANLRQISYEILRLPKTAIEILLTDKLSFSPFATNFLSLNFSSLFIKSLNFLLFLVLVRVLRPEEYGIYILVWSQIALFSPIVDMGTTSYGIVDLPKEKKETFVSLFNLRTVVAIVVFFLTIISGFLIFRSNFRVTKYVLLISFVIFSNLLSGSYLIKNAIEGKLINSSLISAFFNLILVLSMIFFAWTTHSVGVLILTSFVLYNLYSLINYFLIKKDLNEIVFKIEIGKWKKFLAKSLVYVLITFLASLYFRIDVFLLQILKGEKEVGIYSAGYKFLEGMLFIAASYNITRTPILAKIKENRDSFKKIIRKDMIMLSVIGAVLATFFYFFSDLFLTIFLKGGFKNSLQVVKIVMFALPFILVSSVFLNSLYVLNKAKKVVYIFLILVVFNFLLNLIFIPKYSYIASAYITVLSEILNMTILWYTFRNSVKQYANIS